MKPVAESLPLVFATLMTACGQDSSAPDGGGYGSCTFVYHDAAVLCTDFVGSGWANGVAQQFCGDAQVYSTSTCPTAGETSACWFDQDGGIAEEKHCYQPNCTYCAGDAGAD